jgi:hypothetical protein
VRLTIDLYGEVERSAITSGTSSSGVVGDTSARGAAAEEEYRSQTVWRKLMEK